MYSTKVNIGIAYDSQLASASVALLGCLVKTMVIFTSQQRVNGWYLPWKTPETW